MAKKLTIQTNLIHLAEMLQVSMLIKRENRTDFENGIREPLLTGLVVFVNRYVRSMAGFRPLSTDQAKRITLKRSLNLSGLYRPFAGKFPQAGEKKFLQRL
jgi:hypothetical protein